MWDFRVAKGVTLAARARVQFVFEVFNLLNSGNTYTDARTQAILARTRIRLIGAAITDAEANVAASTARYRSGEATITEVVDAQNTLVTQKTALYQALFDYQTARARLMRATGQ